MKAKHEVKTIRDVVELYKAQMLKANPEYQRGAVWSSVQKKKLINSVMRGYPLPLIYLHHLKKTVAGMQSEALEVIDGQQRITALYDFSEGGFSLFDPVEDEAKAKFPTFIKKQPCPWAKKDIHGLSDELREQFFDTPLEIARIESDNPNEVRDIFIRLQSGLPLNAQETRDALPGQFTEFVLWLGGKPELARYPGHAFFSGPLGLSPRTDRGKTRQFAAQLAMIFLLRHERGPDFFSDINAKALDDFYYTKLDFERSASEPKRLVAILDRLATVLGEANLPKLKFHDAIHLVLLVDSLWDDYTRSWESTLPKALGTFFNALAKAKNDKDSPTPDEFWVRYGQWTRVNSDRGERIAHRHVFYMEKMVQYMDPLQLKDPKRIYGDLEREILFFGQNKKCAQCSATIKWGDAQVHHIKEHSQGGSTTLENGALVHPGCHPKGKDATAAFAAKMAALGKVEKTAIV